MFPCFFNRLEVGLYHDLLAYQSFVGLVGQWAFKRYALVPDATVGSNLVLKTCYSYYSYCRVAILRKDSSALLESR